jgi:hypothetical protein
LRDAGLFKQFSMTLNPTLDYTLADLRELIEYEMQTPCIYCDQEITVKNFSIDHSQPTSRDGAHRFQNIHVCCLRCNQIKGALTTGEFTQLRMLLDGFEPVARRDIRARLRSCAWPSIPPSSWRPRASRPTPGSSSSLTPRTDASSSAALAAPASAGMGSPSRAPFKGLSALAV